MLQHLGALMITSQLIGQVTESLIPYIMYRSRVTKVAKEGKKIVMKTADLSDDIERQGTQEKYLVSHFTHTLIWTEHFISPMPLCTKKTKSESWQKSRNELESHTLFSHGDLFLLPKIFSFLHNKLKKSRGCSYFNVSLTFVKAADQRHMAMFLVWSIEYRESLSVSLRSFMPSIIKS